MATCFVVNCKSSQKKGDKLHKVPFPTTDPVWLSFYTEFAKKIINQNSRICEKHFQFLLTDLGELKRYKYPTIIVKEETPPIKKRKFNELTIEPAELPSQQTDTNLNASIKCFIPACGHSRQKNPELNFFILPTKKSVQSKWIKAIKKGTSIEVNQEVFKNSKTRICSVHFKRENCKEITKDGKLFIIRKSKAIPSLFAKKPEPILKDIPERDQQDGKEISLSKVKAMRFQGVLEQRIRNEPEIPINITTKKSGQLELDEETLAKCRICLKAPGLPALTIHSNLPKSRVSIHKAILKTFNFDLSSDSCYPMRICARCFNLIVAAYVLKLEVIKSSSKLVQLSAELKLNPEKEKSTKEFQIVEIEESTTISKPQSPEVVYIKEPLINSPYRFTSPPVILNSTFSKSKIAEFKARPSITTASNSVVCKVADVHKVRSSISTVSKPMMTNPNASKSKPYEPPPIVPPIKKTYLNVPNSNFQLSISEKCVAAPKPRNKEFKVKLLAPTIRIPTADKTHEISEDTQQECQIVSKIKEEPEEMTICDQIFANEIMFEIKEERLEKEAIMKQSEMTIKEEEIEIIF